MVVYFQKVLNVKIIVHLFVFCTVIPCAFSQNVQENPLVSAIIEDFLENSDSENFDFNTVFENLSYYYNHPLDINSATEQELRDLIIISESQINAFFDHRNKFGKFLSIYELQTIDSWNINFIRNIVPFLTIKKGFNELYKFDWNQFYKSGESDLFLKTKRVLQKRKGYVRNEDGVSPYIGDPNSFYLRYRYQAGNYFRLGITAEKDPGEPFFKDINKYGFDFYSFFIHGTKLHSNINSVTLGDFTVSMGQGLILHNDFGGRKSSFVMNIKKGNRFIRPYSSVNEVNYFRGAATELQWTDKLKLGVFVSYKPVNARLDSDTLDNTDFERFTSIVESGLHRTLSEKLVKNLVRQYNVGSSLKFENKNLRLGLNYLYTEFNVTFQKDEELYRKYIFSGDYLHNGSIDYQYQRRNVTFFGEGAMSQNGGTAFTNGLLISLDRKIDMSLLYRHFSPQYQVLNANAFADGTLPINEKGLYMGIEMRPFSKVVVSTYADFWKNPWVSYRRNGPAKGFDYFVKISYILKRKLDFYVQYRFINKQLNQSSETEVYLYAPVDYTVQRFRLHLNYKINKVWEWRSRIEFSNYKKESLSKGVLMYQDILYKPIAKKLSFSARYCIFDIESFDARIYTYENDILFEFFIPFFQHRGTRFYTNIRYRINNFLTWEFRYGNTFYTDNNLIGSGNEFIEGRNRTELKTQIKLSF
ncbi:MAG: helix-hairpin-helix domain-containing protein [Saprospiraceae bacterium]|nr:helix-hairpin-helix domain-containing protein [Saprospiraceae bacterium]